jgi:hypothetical protein
MEFEFSGLVWYWRGPAPFYFVTAPPAVSKELKAMVSMVTYGWGMIPVRAMIGNTEFTTAMFHKNGAYVLPLKDSVRKAEGIEEDDEVAVSIEVMPAAEAYR